MTNRPWIAGAFALAVVAACTSGGISEPAPAPAATVAAPTSPPVPAASSGQASDTEHMDPAAQTTPTIPPIDAAAPTDFQTATFALG